MNEPGTSRGSPKVSPLAMISALAEVLRSAAATAVASSGLVITARVDVRFAAPPSSPDDCFRWPCSADVPRCGGGAVVVPTIACLLTGSQPLTVTSSLISDALYLVRKRTRSLPHVSTATGGLATGANNFSFVPATVQ